MNYINNQNSHRILDIRNYNKKYNKRNEPMEVNISYEGNVQNYLEKKSNISNNPKQMVANISYEENVQNCLEKKSNRSNNSKPMAANIPYEENVPKYLEKKSNISDNLKSNKNCISILKKRTLEESQSYANINFENSNEKSKIYDYNSKKIPKNNNSNNKKNIQ